MYVASRVILFLCLLSYSLGDLALESNISPSSQAKGTEPQHLPIPQFNPPINRSRILYLTL